MPGRIQSRRVMILEPSGNMWGSERALLDLCEGLKHTRWVAGLCCPPDTQILDNSGGMFDIIYPVFIANLHKKNKLMRLVAVWRLIRVIRAYHPDLIYVNQAGATKIALIAASLTRCNVVTHTRLLEDVEYLKAIAKESRLKRILCVSHFIREAFCEDDHVVDSKLADLHDCYQITHADIKLPTVNQNVLVCPSRLALGKGQDVLLKAFALFHKDRADARLILLGTSSSNDSFESELHILTEQLNVQDDVEFKGFVQDIWPYLTAADFLICPSHLESLGRIIFEAWDAGIIPIAFRGSGGPAETIRASGGGILYDSQEPQRIADTLKCAYQIPMNERYDMVMRGRDWMKKNLDPVVYGKKIAAIFDDSI